jgi:hypothetical protein
MFPVVLLEQLSAIKAVDKDQGLIVFYTRGWFFIRIDRKAWRSYMCRVSLPTMSKTGSLTTSCKIGHLSTSSISASADDIF